MEGDGEEGEEGVEDVKRGVGVKGEGKGGCGGRGGRAKKRVWKEVYVENCSMFHLLTVSSAHSRFTGGEIQGYTSPGSWSALRKYVSNSMRCLRGHRRTLNTWHAAS